MLMRVGNVATFFFFKVDSLDQHIQPSHVHNSLPDYHHFGSENIHILMKVYKIVVIIKIAKELNMKQFRFR